MKNLLASKHLLSILLCVVIALQLQSYFNIHSLKKSETIHHKSSGINTKMKSNSRTVIAEPSNKLTSIQNKVISDTVITSKEYSPEKKYSQTTEEENFNEELRKAGIEIEDNVSQ